MKQVLCIESTVSPDASDADKPVKAGEIYTPTSTKSYGVVYKGLDMWYTLKERRQDNFFHVSIFVDLPNEEGQVFKKKVEEPETIKA